ncbi:alpha/beta hydrolase [Budvicia diplopodorum]|uniref:alpha/beta hydrolase n=1 Tax=Budvicia diplopodorum TaxID=1119056 RepID=UPI001356871D|nr:alpha/beta hydrolase [Budvicia diplopodorum]
MLKALSAILLIAGIIPFSSHARSIQWESCLNSKFHSWFNDSPHPSLRCGYLEVPLRYKNGTSIEQQRSDKTVRLALTLLPAKGVRKGSLVAISGGPGIPGINPLLSTDWPVNKLSESWDIVGYDPRGVGQSTPKINCKVPESASAAVTSQEQEARNMLKACIENTGVEVLKHIGTDEAVSDVDRIRQALGDSRLTAVAYSYGTQVAALYAERFPSTIRAIVMDGVVDLEETKDGFTWRLNQARGYQKTFERFAVWCAETGSCPLSSDKMLATRQYRNLLNKLHSQPLYGAEDRQISSDDLISLTTSLLLWRSSWPSLATAVRQLSIGIVSKEVIGLLDYSASFGDPDALNAISYTDQSVRELSQIDIRRQQRLIREAFAATNYQPQEVDSLDLCDLWPWKNNVHAKRPADVPNLPQLLFVAQRHDPTTPWHNARAMATLFRSPLLTLEGDGHTLALSGANLCVDKAAVDYLTNPDKKRDDSVCR